MTKRTGDCRSFLVLSNKKQPAVLENCSGTIMKNKGDVLKEREKFGSRMGFILVSAGCAIGLGNGMGNFHTWQENTAGRHLF